MAAVRAEPFDPAVGRRIGAELVDLRMSAPPVIGTTVRLLGDVSRRWPPTRRRRRTRTRARPARPPHHRLRHRPARRRGRRSRADEPVREDPLARVQTDLQQRLQHALRHDPRTGLPNEQHLRTHLADHGRRRRGPPGPLPDRRRPLRGARRHPRPRHAGLLAAIGHRLRQVAKPGGHFLAHLGDDQFAIAVTDTCDADDVIKLAEDARHAMLTPFPLDGHALRVGVTAGVVEDQAAGAEPDHWVRDARLALGWARQDRHDHAVFEGPRAEADRYRHRLAAALPAALEAGEFLTHYQPLYRLSDRALIGVEAVARWQRPGEAVPLTPRHFITLAERTGTIRQLGRTLLEQACRQGAAWPDLVVGVNLSPLQLGDPSFAIDVADILHRTGLPADRLQLEITESATLNQSFDTLRHLADLGVRLALDDFGTGQSGIAALSWLPIRTVKLAAEFIVDTGGRASVEVLRHVIALCHALGVTVTAQGIETAGQEQMLQTLGCDHGQGYHFAGPAASSRISARPRVASRC